MHEHQIRREANVDRTELWSEVMSHGLSEDGLKGLIEDRRHTPRAQMQFLQPERERAWADRTVGDSLIFERAMACLEAVSRPEQPLDAPAKRVADPPAALPIHTRAAAVLP
jgi:hypothetical protein